MLAISGPTVDNLGLGLGGSRLRVRVWGAGNLGVACNLLTLLPG